MSAVVIAAQIVGHIRKSGEDGSPAACTFLFDSTSEYIEYKIKVHAPQLPYEPIIVRRRFSEFLKLHSDLKERQSRSLLAGSGGGGPASDEFLMPDKKLLGTSSPLKNFSSRLDEEFIEDRKTKLQAYLNVALRSPLSSEMLVDWEEPLTSFLSIARLLAPTDSGSGGGGPGDGRNWLGGCGRGPGRVGPPAPPPPPPFTQVRSAAALRLARVVRGHFGRARAWQALLARARPLYVSVAHVSGYAKAGASSTYVSAASFGTTSYCPYLLVTAHDPATGRQLSAARSLTAPATPSTDWEWNADELLCLQWVLPNSVLVVTVLDSCSIGRDNFLGQASSPLTPPMAKVYALEPPPPLAGCSGGGADVSSSSLPSSAVAAAALVVPRGRASSLNQRRGSGNSSPPPPGPPFPPPANGGNGKKSSSLWGGKAMPQQQQQQQQPGAPPSHARSLRLSSDGGEGLRGSVSIPGGCGSLRPVNALEMKIRSEQEHDVWQTGAPSEDAFEAFVKKKKSDAEAAAAAAEGAAAEKTDTLGGSNHGLGGSNHGKRSSIFGGLSGSGHGDALGGSNHGKRTLSGAASMFRRSTSGGSGGGGGEALGGSSHGLGGSSHGLGGSNHGKRPSIFGSLGGSNHGSSSPPRPPTAAAGEGAPTVAPAAAHPPASFDMSRAWEFGEVTATLRWCPLHAFKSGVMYRLVLPVGMGLGFRKPAWTRCFVVLTRDELLQYHEEGDAKPLRKFRVADMEKAAATSCNVVAETAAVPDGVDPWDSVLTVGFDTEGARGSVSAGGGSGDAGSLHLLCPNGAAGQRQWKRALSDAIVHAQSAAVHSGGAHGGGGGVGADAGAGGLRGSESGGFYDLSFLPPSRPRLPTVDSVRSVSTTRDTLDLPSTASASTPPGAPGDAGDDDAFLRPRSSSTGSMKDGHVPERPSANPFSMRESIMGAFRESGL